MLDDIDSNTPRDVSSSAYKELYRIQGKEAFIRYRAKQEEKRFMKQQLLIPQLSRINRYYKGRVGANNYIPVAHRPMMDPRLHDKGEYYDSQGPFQNRLLPVDNKYDFLADLLINGKTNLYTALLDKININKILDKEDELPYILDPVINGEEEEEEAEEFKDAEGDDDEEEEKE